MSQFLQKSLAPATQIAVDEELANMAAHDFQPFSIMDDKGFRRFTHALNPMYIIPTGKHSQKSPQDSVTENVLQCKRGFKKLQQFFEQLTAGHLSLPHPTCQL